MFQFIPGGSTIIFAVIAFLWLPRSPSTWSFLSGREKEVARLRILADSSVTVDEKLSLRDSIRPFASPMYWYGETN
jgi:hypothetical protein